ncbi:hydroxyacylglutathione hydrolase [Candidatus Nitrotoga fabula]|uniref:Hydroxyacylglutathione hydrolase n=1 Tax=Candidatus Nitrotoga fabula TaxID=2182327 RepID=A0A916BDU2_9PROT|nr:hydroxyacylglutathione hydrolase [Candidatus Nitrotoga fabula]CAE6698569.1 Hydroxyacylglutathione hydrolase [Candidatus Nitrotoga fabula]
MIKIIALPAFRDNYIWTLHNQQYAVVVDPGDASPVLDYLDRHNLRLVAILCTHHHHDHTDGIHRLHELYSVPVYGPSLEAIPCVSHTPDDGEIIEISELPVRMQVMHVPGHTRRHIAYAGASGVFCGDTLFGCGCGRIFDGTVEQLFHSLKRLASLPDETRVYCTHEYTEVNIRFALACEPGNARLRQRQADTQSLRAAGLPTLPSTIALEKATNPFLRCNVPEIVARVSGLTQVNNTGEFGVFSALRTLRNHF